MSVARICYLGDYLMLSALLCGATSPYERKTAHQSDLHFSHDHRVAELLAANKMTLFDADGAQIISADESESVGDLVATFPVPQTISTAGAGHTACRCQHRLPWAVPPDLCGNCQERHGVLTLGTTEHEVVLPKMQIPFRSKPFVPGRSQAMVEPNICPVLMNKLAPHLQQTVRAISAWANSKAARTRSGTIIRWPEIHTYDSNTTEYLQQGGRTYSDPHIQTLRESFLDPASLKFASRNNTKVLDAKHPRRFGRCALVSPGGILRHRQLAQEISEHDTVFGIHTHVAMAVSHHRDMPLRMDYIVLSGSHTEDINNATGKAPAAMWSTLETHECFTIFHPHHFKSQAAADHFWNAVLPRMQERCKAVAGVVTAEVYPLWWHFRRLSYPHAPSYGGASPVMMLYMLKHCTSVKLYGVYPVDVFDYRTTYYMHDMRISEKVYNKTCNGPSECIPALSALDTAILHYLHCMGLIDIRV